MKDKRKNILVVFGCVVLLAAFVASLLFSSHSKIEVTKPGEIEIQSGTYRIHFKDVRVYVHSNITIANVGDEPLHNVSIVQIFSIIRDEVHPLNGNVCILGRTLGTLDAHSSRIIATGADFDLSEEEYELVISTEHLQSVLYIDIYQGKEWHRKRPPIRDKSSEDYHWIAARYSKVDKLNDSLVYGYLDTLLSVPMAIPTPTLIPKTTSREADQTSQIRNEMQLIHQFLKEDQTDQHEFKKSFECIFSPLAVKIGSQLLFWNIPQSLPENSSNSTFIQLLMHGNSQSLLCSIR